MSDPAQWKGKGCGEQAERDQRGRMLTTESIAEAVTPCRVSVTGGLRSQRASPAPQPPLGASQGPFHSVRNVSLVLLQEEEILCRDPHSASRCKVCFLNGAGFHALSRSSSAFVTYVNLLWKMHGKANYCPDTAFRQTSNVSPRSECGISDSSPLCQCMIRATVVTGAGCA